MVITALIVVPLYMLFIRDDGKDKEAPSQSALVEAAKDPAKAAAVLEQRIGDHKQGIDIRYPSDWRGQVDQGTVRVTSPDQTTAIAVSAKAGAPQAKSLFKAAVDGASADFKNAEVSYAQKPTPIAGLPSAQAVIKGSQGGAPRTALVAVVRGTQRSYVVSVLAPAQGGDVGVANLILVRGLRLTG